MVGRQCRELTQLLSAMRQSLTSLAKRRSSQRAPTMRRDEWCQLCAGARLPRGALTQRAQQATPIERPICTLRHRAVVVASRKTGVGRTSNARHIR